MWCPKTMPKRADCSSKSYRHVPFRTCVVCRAKKPKSEMTRLVRTCGGTIQLDLQQREQGRAAYVCAARDCQRVGPQKSQLERAMRIPLSPFNWEQLAGSVGS